MIPKKDRHSIWANTLLTEVCHRTSDCHKEVARGRCTSRAWCTNLKKTSPQAAAETELLVPRGAYPFSIRNSLTLMASKRHNGNNQKLWVSGSRLGCTRLHVLHTHVQPHQASKHVLYFLWYGCHSAASNNKDSSVYLGHAHFEQKAAVRLNICECHEK